MLREEQKSLLAQILADPSDIAKVSEIVTQLTEDYIDVTSSAEIVLSENEALKTENAKLRDQNMQLFLKVGAPVKDEEPEENEPEIENLSYDDLFNESGLLV